MRFPWLTILAETGATLLVIPTHCDYSVKKIRSPFHFLFKKTLLAKRFMRYLQHVTLTMTTNQATPNSRIVRAIGMRLFLVFCIAVYSLAGAPTKNIVITHGHAETHEESHHDHPADSDGGDDHHKNTHDNNSGDEDEHHHHIACYGSVALTTVDPANYSLFHRVMKHGLLSHNEIHPTGPTFEIVKPPQVA